MKHEKEGKCLLKCKKVQKIIPFSWIKGLLITDPQSCILFSTFWFSFLLSSSRPDDSYLTSQVLSRKTLDLLPDSLSNILIVIS